jgi:hypothetical protein
MNLDIIEELKSGDDERIMRIGESDTCVVIDWKDGPVEIVEALVPFLPSGYLQCETDTSDAVRIAAGGRPVQKLTITSRKQEPFLDSLNNLISPEFELRQFRPCDGDGYSLLVRSSQWWTEVSKKDPELIEKYFLPTQRLARYWSKGFFSRLFSKP